MANETIEQAILLTIPGFMGSGAEHWQTKWEQTYSNVVRIHQPSWDAPQLDVWLENIEQAVQQYHGRSIVLVAHSLGTIAVAHWARRTQSKIAGALLVAPPDLDNTQLIPHVQSFVGVPLDALPFKSIVVASTNDQYASIAQAQGLAQAWGSTFINIGQRGHINADSKLGVWAQGWEFIEQLR